jgi:hypothetical protein
MSRVTAQLPCRGSQPPGRALRQKWGPKFQLPDIPQNPSQIGSCSSPDSSALRTSCWGRNPRKKPPTIHLLQGQGMLTLLEHLLYAIV